MVEVGLDLDTVGLTVDEGRHACSGKAHTVVVKILAVNALDAFAAVLVAIGSHVRFERTVSALLRVGLVGPVETVHGATVGDVCVQYLEPLCQEPSKVSNRCWANGFGSSSPSLLPHEA